GKQGQEGKQSQPQQRQPSQTTGQGQQGKQAPSQQQGKQAPSQQGKQGTQSGQTTGQGQQGQQQGREQGQQGREQRQQNQGGRQDQSGRITLNTEQRTRIRQTVFAQSNVPRVNNVNFAVRVGTVVPARVRLVAVVPALIEIRPEFRDHEFFVVNDEIVVVDHSRRIVAVVDTGGSSGADLRRSRSGRGQVASFDNLSVEEIREVQLVLIQQGFDIGVADGRLGAKTREALISFQRRNGLQASGRIDSQTVARLGVNIRGQGGQSTTGQGQEGPANQQPPANQNMGREGNQNMGREGNQNMGREGNQNMGREGNQNMGRDGNQNMGREGNQPSTTGQGANPSDRTGGTMQQQPGANPPANQKQQDNNRGGAR